LGQGFGQGVGMAIAATHLAAEFNNPGHEIIQSYIYGIVTDGDLRRSLQRLSSSDLAFANLTCDELMTRNPVIASPEMLAFEALRLMEDRPSQINVLPVVNADGFCVGLIRLHDIIRSGL